METLPIDLWLWPLDGPAAPCLSAEEEARAARFVRPRDGHRYRCGRAHLREILSSYTGTPPAALRIHTGAQGKPSVPGGPAFNLSHAGGWAALAVTKAPVDLGLDIEAVRTVEPAIAERFFSAREIDALSALPKPDWATGFFRLWTRKEAVVKALGGGLSIPLDRFAVTLTPEARLLSLDTDLGDPAQWRLTNLDLGPDLFGAIATRHPARHRITVRQGQLPLTLTP